MKMFETVSSGRVLRVFVALCFTAFALLAGACAGPPTSPDGNDSGCTGSSTQVNYTAVGASDAIGVGASVSCLPFIDCPTGTGYVQILHRQLATGGKQVSLLNLGISGAVLSPRIQTISRSYGPSVNFNFMESELPLERFPLVPSTRTWYFSPREGRWLPTRWICERACWRTGTGA